MKRKLLALSRSYLAALQRYLLAGAGARLVAAKSLGAEAVASGLETLDLARIHELALAALVPPNGPAAARRRLTRRAEVFFAEANLAIVETHVATVEVVGRLQQIHETLGRRTEELAVARRSLRRGIVHRKTAQQNFKKRAARSARLLDQSRQLQEHLRRLTRQIFSTQEEERKKMSQELHDEIAQTLLGINVRLITLKQDAQSGAAGLHRDIDGTRRLVEKSARTMLRLAHEFSQTSTARRPVGKTAAKRAN